MFHRIAVTVALALFAGWPAWAQFEPPYQSKGKPVPGIEVELRFSVETLDALKPEKSYVEFLLRNMSEKWIA